MKNFNPWKSKRRFITLIEMMIVMFLIAMITGVVAYNYRGSLETGKAFKTKTGADRLENALSLILAEDPEADLSTWQNLIKHSPLVNNPADLIKDGWGETYQVSWNEEKNRIEVHSRRYEEYQKKNKGLK